MKQIFRRYVEMDEQDNDALFKVLATMLEYAPHEKRAMQLARERRAGKRSSIWGFA